VTVTVTVVTVVTVMVIERAQNCSEGSFWKIVSTDRSE
jgi:hypothetical protein